MKEEARTDLLSFGVSWLMQKQSQTEPTNGGQVLVEELALDGCSVWASPDSVHVLEEVDTATRDSAGESARTMSEHVVWVLASLDPGPLLLADDGAHGLVLLLPPDARQVERERKSPRRQLMDMDVEPTEVNHHKPDGWPVCDHRAVREGRMSKKKKDGLRAHFRCSAARSPDGFASKMHCFLLLMQFWHESPSFTIP